MRVFEDYEVGESWRSVGRTITDADIRLFVGATADDHPNHTNAEYCKAHPIFDRPCAQGVLVLGVVDGFLAYEVTRYMSASLNYGHDRIRYLAPVYVNDTVYAEFRVSGRRERSAEWGLLEFDVQVRNQDDVLSLAETQLILVNRRTGL